MTDPQLQAILDRVKQLPADSLPRFLGDLEEIRITAQMRLTTPAAQAPSDRLVDINEAAERLNLSTDHIYRHKDEYPFTCCQGRKVLFSSNGIDKYIQQNRR